MKRRPLRLVFGVFIFVVGVSALVVFANDWIPVFYNAYPPTPHYQRPHTLAEAQRDDLDYLRNITRIDWSYTDQTRAAANAVIDRAVNGSLPLSPAAFQLVLARVLAIADNGHTNVRGGGSANRFNRLPIRLYNFADGIFVVRALPQAKALLGAQLLAIDGIAVKTLRAQLRQFTGGTESEKNARLPFYLESPELLNAAGLAKAMGGVSLTVVNSQGSEETISLDALPAQATAPKIWPSEELKPVPIPEEDPAWIPALKGKAETLAMFANGPHAFFAGWLASESLYYVRFDTNGDDNGISIKDFADRTLKAILRRKPPVVVVDLRMNGGGDYTTTASFMSHLPEQLSDARIFVLMSQETFSAGISSAAFLKQAGGKRVIFAGDWPGDRLRFHSEGSDFCLPYSTLCVTARTAIHDYSTRWCRPLFECYLLDRLYPVSIQTLAPEIYAPLTYASLARGNDPGLSAIVSTISGTRVMRN